MDKMARDEPNSSPAHPALAHPFSTNDGSHARQTLAGSYIPVGQVGRAAKPGLGRHVFPWTTIASDALISGQCLFRCRTWFMTHTEGALDSRHKLEGTGLAATPARCRPQDQESCGVGGNTSADLRNQGSVSGSQFPERFSHLVRAARSTCSTVFLVDGAAS